MEMVRRGIIDEDKYIFSQWCSNLWDLPGKYKKIWLIEVTSARKCSKLNSNRETGGRQLSRQPQKVHGANSTDMFRKFL